MRSEVLMPRVRIYTSPHCGDCRRAKRFLDERGVPFEEVKIEEVARAAEFVLAANRGRRRVPTLDVDRRVSDLSPFDAARLGSEFAANLPCVQTVRPA
jgi:glutaredoxin